MNDNQQLRVQPGEVSSSFQFQRVAEGPNDESNSFLVNSFIPQSTGGDRDATRHDSRPLMTSDSKDFSMVHDSMHFSQPTNIHHAAHTPNHLQSSMHHHQINNSQSNALGLSQASNQAPRDSIELVAHSTQPFNLNARDNLENFYTGALAAELNRSYSASVPRGLSHHTLSNSLSLRQESLRLEKTLKLRQKGKQLEEQLKIAVLQNQGLRQKNDELQYQCNLRQDKIEDLGEEILTRERCIQALKQQMHQDRIDAERTTQERIKDSLQQVEETRL